MKIKNYINGEYVNPISNNWIENYNPSIGEVYGQLPDSNSEDVEIAYKAAETAFLSWSETTLDERSKILSKIAKLIIEKLPELALAEAKDNGKPVHVAKSIDIPRASANFQFFANFSPQRSHEPQNLPIFVSRRRGLHSAICVWPFPLKSLLQKILFAEVSLKI